MRPFADGSHLLDAPLMRFPDTSTMLPDMSCVAIDERSVLSIPMELSTTKSHANQFKVDEAILTKFRAERASRKMKREWMTRHGLNPTRAQTIYRLMSHQVCPIPTLKQARGLLTSRSLRALALFSGSIDSPRAKQRSR